MTDEPRTLVFATVDGFEVLVTLWPDTLAVDQHTAISASLLARPGTVEVALRPAGQRSWGPPLEMKRA